MPWSTWPMTVTTGARGSSISGSSALAAQPDLDVGLGDASHAVAELGTISSAVSASIDLVDRRHHAHAHQRLDHVGAALGHAVGQLLDRDRLGDDDVAHDLGLLLAAHPLALALAGAADRGKRAHPLAGVVVERAGHGQLAGAAALLVGAAHRGRPAAQIGTTARAGSRRPALFLFLAGTAILPAAVSAATLAAAALPARSATSRRDSSSLRRASSSSARFLVSSSARFLASSSSTRLRASSSARSAPRWRSVPPPGAGGRPPPGRRGGANHRPPCARPAGRARGSRAPRRSACAAPRACGQPGRPPAGVAAGPGWARAAVGAAGSGRPASGAAPGAMTRFLRTSTATAFERPCEKLCRTWPGSLGRRRLSVAPERSVRGRFCSCSLASWSFASVMRFGTTILYRRPGRREIRCLLQPPRRSENLPAATSRAAGGGTASRRPPPRAQSGRGRTPRRVRPPSSTPPTASRARARPAFAARRLGAIRAQTAKAPPCPCRTASPTRSNPATASPARRAKPSESPQRRASRRSSRSARSGGTVTGRRAARAKTRLASARSTISRRGVNHKPRPGSRAVDIRHDRRHPGPTTKRSSASRSRTSPVTMQRRCGDADCRRPPPNRPWWRGDCA